MSAIALTAADRTRLRKMHPELFSPSVFKRWGGLMLLVGALAYLVYCWNFFEVGPKLAEGKWERASIYMADWISWEAQPRYRFQPDGTLQIEHQRFSPLGENPDPDWMTALPDGRE